MVTAILKGVDVFSIIFVPPMFFLMGRVLLWSYSSRIVSIRFPYLLFLIGRKKKERVNCHFPPWRENLYLITQIEKYTQETLLEH